jgi:ribosomal protein S5
MRRQTDEFENEIIDIRRVSKVTKGGRNLFFRVLIVIGDCKGRVGVGRGNTTEIPRAIQQAIRDANNRKIQGGEDLVEAGPSWDGDYRRGDGGSDLPPGRD